MAFVCRDPTALQKALNDLQAPLRAIQAANQGDGQGRDSAKKLDTSEKAGIKMSSLTAPAPLLDALESAHVQDAINAAKAAGLIGVVTLEDVLEVLLSEEVGALQSFFDPKVIFRLVFSGTCCPHHFSLLSSPRLNCLLLL